MWSSGYTANNQIVGYSYDAAGNLLNDGVHSATHPAASLGPDSAPSVPTHPEQPGSDAEELFATLDAEAAEEESES